MFTVGVAFFAMLATIAIGHAQTSQPIPPPLSVPKALYFRNNPAAWSAFLARLPRRPVGPPQVNQQPVSPPFGGSWTTLTTTGAPTTESWSNPLLLTDGTVLVHDAEALDWYKLTPDDTGSYANGTWSQVASLPTGYAPLYFASAVLPDGRVIIQGGEYNAACSANNPVWVNQGAIYDPVANSWSAVSPPSGWGSNTCGASLTDPIGDAQSIVLPDGTFMLGACCGDPSVSALLNATTLAYSATGAPPDYQDEQGYILLPTGKVLTIDVWDPNATHLYSAGAWVAGASTPMSLVDPVACGNYEIGPAVTRPDGTTVAFGGNTGCTTPAADPTAIYTASTNQWVAGPNIPQVSSQYFDLADAPAAMLPNGNILFAASPGYGNTPTHFFEFTSTNAIDQVADPKDFASTNGAYYYNFLDLPNGQILMTDFSNIAEVYTPTGSPKPAWAPSVASAPSCVVPGQSYALSGAQLNGLTQGAAYGDDVQGATNYPLVRIKNNSTGKVFYARTSGFSTMSIASGQTGSTNFTPASATPLGASTLYVVANGIASAGTAVTVASTCSVASATLTVTPATDIVDSGTQGKIAAKAFSYKLAAENGSVAYSITGVPTWLTASKTSGTLAKNKKVTITFRIATAKADKLTPSTYVTSININNATNGDGNTTRNATLTVNPKPVAVWGNE